MAFGVLPTHGGARAGIFFPELSQVEWVLLAIGKMKSVGARLNHTKHPALGLAVVMPVIAFLITGEVDGIFLGRVDEDAARLHVAGGFYRRIPLVIGL